MAVAAALLRLPASELPAAVASLLARAGALRGAAAVPYHGAPTTSTRPRATPSAVRAVLANESELG